VTSATAAHAPAERLHYRAAIPVVPAGAASVVLTLRLEPSALPVEAHALVGNALLACPLGAPTERATPHASLHWTEARELRLESQGKALELVVELAETPGSDDERAALEHALLLGTSALVDGKPFEGVVTRLERAP
jgi:hypothetical protein